MESTYAFFGVPEALATAIVLIALSIALAPWFGGLEIGPLKVPAFRNRSTLGLRVGGPAAFLVAVAGFFPLWGSAGEEEVQGTVAEAVPYDDCRVPRLTGPYEHHNNGCIARGYLGYDPAPERTRGEGVCYAREECKTFRPGIDPY